MTAQVPGPVAARDYDRAVDRSDTPDHHPAWDRFAAWMGVLSDLDGMDQLLEWDQETAMPAAGTEGRSRLFGTVALLLHRELVRPDMEETLAQLAADPDLDADRRAMVRLAARERARATAIPEDLARVERELESRCTAAWRDAREADDLAPFATAFAPLLDVKREIAGMLADGGEPYDALLDRFEPGARASELEPLFADLRNRLAPIVDAASGRPAPELPDARWDEADQLKLAHAVARMMGFDPAAGAIGFTAHPFTSMHHRGDVRFSTHIDPRNPVTNVLVVLHEVGHALYDQGLPAWHDRTLLHVAPSLGAHESQSRFCEMHVGCGSPFWRRLEPEMRRLFPAQMDGVDAESLAATTRVVRPGALRLEADEVTYNLHIIVRFELELALLRGDLGVADLPGAWADRVEALLGVRPAGHRDGVLQDVHWAAGLIGYFPTYTLGNIYAAQLRAALEEEVGALDEIVQRGDFGVILEFMRDRVHRHGRRYETRELMRAATGRELGVDELISHLERRYLDS
jgi:carboxypeptidase Taq